MSKKPISVAKHNFIWLVGVILIIIGFFRHLWDTPPYIAGFGLIILGFIIMGINKLVFKTRREATTEA